MKNINPVLKFKAKRNFLLRNYRPPLWFSGTYVPIIGVKACLHFKSNRNTAESNIMFMERVLKQQTFFTGVQRTLSYVTPDESNLDGN